MDTEKHVNPLLGKERLRICQNRYRQNAMDFVHEHDGIPYANNEAFNASFSLDREIKKIALELLKEEDRKLAAQGREGLKLDNLDLYLLITKMNMIVYKMLNDFRQQQGTATQVSTRFSNTISNTSLVTLRQMEPGPHFPPSGRE